MGQVRQEGRKRMEGLCQWLELHGTEAGCASQKVKYRLQRGSCNLNLQVDVMQDSAERKKHKQCVICGVWKRGCNRMLPHCCLQYICVHP